MFIMSPYCGKLITVGANTSYKCISIYIEGADQSTNHVNKALFVSITSIVSSEDIS